MKRTRPVFDGRSRAQSLRPRFDGKENLPPNQTQKVSESGKYYAFLSSINELEEQGFYELVFEVVPKEWGDNVIFYNAGLKPAQVLRFGYISEASILVVSGTNEQVTRYLGLNGKTALDDAEGEWYLIEELEFGVDDALAGELFSDPPDSDTTAAEP